MPTALIVEDEPAANDLLSALVQLRGYRTDSAFTGTEALEKIGRRPLFSRASEPVSAESVR